MMSAFMMGNSKRLCEEFGYPMKIAHTHIGNTHPTTSIASSSSGSQTHCGCFCGLTEFSKLSNHRGEGNNFTPGPAKASKPPPTVFCYICSRQYGSKSIALHEPKCLEKWKAEQAKLPKSQRRGLPTKPEVFLKSDGKMDVEAMNEAAWQASQANLLPCDNCGRTFNPDRLPIHYKSCTPDNPMKRITRKE